MTKYRKKGRACKMGKNDVLAIPDSIKLKPDTVAELLGVTPKTVRKWVRENKLPSANPGGHHRILGKDLKEFANDKKWEIDPNTGVEKIESTRRSRAKSRTLIETDEIMYSSWLHKAKMTGEIRFLPDVFKDVLDNQVYRTNDVATLLGVTPAAVRIFVSQKGLRSLNQGGHHVILGKDLKEFLFKRIT